jgi:DNA-binding transcriptional ArsR family regulator
LAFTLKPNRPITDAQVAKALAHPLRVNILRILEARTASPRELAIELDTDLSGLSYHVRTLHRMGFIELVEQKRRRAALESYYRATSLPVVTREAWVEMPGMVKKQFVSGVIGQIGDEVNAAVEHGGFEGADAHLSRVALKLDAQGRKEVDERLTVLLDELQQIGDAAEARMRAHDAHDEAVDTTTALLFFETAPATQARQSASAGGDRAERPRRSTPSARPPR